MNILHVVQCYYPAVGGAEWLVQNLSEQLASRYSDRVTVFTAAADKPAYFWRPEGAALPVGVEQIQGVTVRRFKVFRGFRFVRMLFAHAFHRLGLPYNDWARAIQVGPLIFDMAQAVARSDADIVMASSFPFMHMYYALAGAKRAGIPVVLLGAIHVADKWGYDREMMYQAIRRADAYIALTTYERDHLIERGVQPDKIQVIGAGVNADGFANADGTALRHEFGWGDDLVVAVVARQTVLKRLDVLLCAMAQVWKARPDVRLLMAGSRTEYSIQLEQIIQSMPESYQEQITAINDFPEEAKPSILAACDLLVHPSGYESFGIVLIEAWACAKPVIGARSGAIPSVIDEGVDGLLFTFNDPNSLAATILELLADSQKRERMGKAGQRKVLRNYRWEMVTDRLRQTYQHVISTHFTPAL